MSQSTECHEVTLPLGRRATNAIRTTARAGSVSSAFQTLLTAAWVSLAGAAVLAGAEARADVLRLDNNDLMHGKVLGADDKNVKFKHVHAGEVTIPWASIVYVQTDEPVALKMIDGTVIKSKLGVGDAPKTVKVDIEGSKEPTKLAIDRIVAVNEPPDEAIWTGRIALGATIQDGNTRTKSIFASFDGERKTKRDRIEAHGLYNYGEAEGDLNSRNSYARMQYSYYFWNPLYVYVGAALEYDRFKDLDLRSRGGGGFGYEAFGGPDKILRFEGGVEYVHEDLHTAADREFVALRFALQAEWQVTDWLRLAELWEILPNTERFRDFVSRSTSSANLKLWGGLGFAGVIIWVHDEVPSPGLGRDDTTYILTLTYTF